MGKKEDIAPCCSNDSLFSRLLLLLLPFLFCSLHVTQLVLVLVVVELYESRDSSSTSVQVLLPEKSFSIGK